MRSDSDLHEPRTNAEQSETGDDLRGSFESEPQRSADGRLMYFEHQLQRSDRYDGLLADWPIDRARLIFRELLSYTQVCSAYDLPLPPAGLPGRLGERYNHDEPAADLILIGLRYLSSIVCNERRSMHNRWDDAREFIRRIEERTEERVLDEAAREWSVKNAAAKVGDQQVYFIGSASGPIKIGIAVNPRNRLKSLQTGHHERLEILATCDGGAEQESAYHKRFADHRLNGEWFERSPTIEAEIERLSKVALP